ncbi:MAG: MBL fold metallo-hydrolase [Candidatus Thorarchaeota archaeon]|jgi:L-ascorbate metabolism protein UlaG (beta-lactamase superfamily)
MIRYLGQSGFLLESKGQRLLIDPKDKKSGDVDGDFVYCTHKHFDHTGGVQSFLERNPEAKLLGNQQVIDKFPRWNERAITANKDESFSSGPWTIEFVQARHGFFRGVRNLGVVAKTSDFVFGHCGDAVDFSGFANKFLDLIAIPIGGGFTASPKRAKSELAKFEQPLPRIVIMHWLLRRPDGFCRNLKEAFPDARCIVPATGELLPL